MTQEELKGMSQEELVQRIQKLEKEKTEIVSYYRKEREKYMNLKNIIKNTIELFE